MQKQIRRALISVFHKEGLEPIIRKLNELSVELLSTGGTYDFIVGMGIPCQKVESVTGLPSILHGRVKTLHPNIFGGILAQRSDASDQQEMQQYNISPIDLVIVDLYPFEATVANGGTHEEIIEKIDIGGISLIRAAAKNYQDVVIVPSMAQYSQLMQILERGNGSTTLEDRISFARSAFAVSSQYDSAIFNYFDKGNGSALRVAADHPTHLRYGENPHQKGIFYGDLDKYFQKLQGKDLSYNNLQDIAAAVELMREFNDHPTFAVLKHTNPCGLAQAENISEAWEKALAADPESVFGGILIANREIDLATATSINKLFFEVLIAPSYSTDALQLLSEKKNRIILAQREDLPIKNQIKSVLGGILVQDADSESDNETNCKTMSNTQPTKEQIGDCIFAQRIVKHCKSNAIVIAKDGQMLASGVGQTSRVAALKQAIEKAKQFGMNLEGAVIASDAFFPFGDCVEIGAANGIRAFIEPGGSIRDNLSIEAANKLNVALIFTGTRHFKH